MDAETATNVVGNLLLFATAIAIGLIPLIVIGLWMKEKAQQNGSRKSQTISDDERRGGPNESSRPSRLTGKISRPPTSDVSIESSWPPRLTGKVSKNPTPDVSVESSWPPRLTEKVSKNPAPDVSAPTVSDIKPSSETNVPTASETDSREAMYERGIAELDTWEAEKDAIPPEQRAALESQAETIRLERQERAARQQREEAERRKLAEHWLSLDGRAFEEELARLYRDLGYVVHLTRQSGDDGIDLVLEADGKQTVVQCKRHQQTVGPGAVRELYGAMMHLHAHDAILAGTSGFTSGVFDFVKGKPITLLDLDELVAMSQAAAFSVGLGSGAGNLTTD